MEMRNIRESFFRFAYPVIGRDLSARITETAFAGIRNRAFRAAFFASVEMIPEFFSVSAI